MHLECYVLFWSSQLKKDAYRLERVQRKPMEMIKGRENLPCEQTQSLSSMEEGQSEPHHSIPVLKGQPQRGQRLFLHKEHMEKSRGKRCKLYPGRLHLDVRKTFFAMRPIIHLNSLRRDIVEPDHWRFSRCVWTGC